MASIEGKLANLQLTQQKLQANNFRPATEKLVEEVKQGIAQCIVKVSIIQVEMGGICAKISMPVE